MSGRYAIYFAPLAGSDLARFGDRWLGRVAESAAAVEQFALVGLDAPAMHALTAAPRHYGFHGTLKPPFHLAAGSDEAELRRSLSVFAAGRRGFDLAGLRLRDIGDFLALVPDEPSVDLSLLAETCVTAFDSFRATPAPSELARRKAADLTPRQAELLVHWGYPYVLDEFRFHLTLTGPIAAAADRARLSGLLRPLLAPFVSRPVPVRELCLFHQPDLDTPFRLINRFPFAQ